MGNLKNLKNIAKNLGVEINSLYNIFLISASSCEVYKFVKIFANFCEEWKKNMYFTRSSRKWTFWSEETPTPR